MAVKRDLRTYAPVAYVVGLVGLVLAGAWFAVVRRPDMTVWVGLVAGVLGLALGIALDPGRVRAFLRGRQARYGLNALLLSLAVTGVVGVVNYLVYLDPPRLDMTEDQAFSLAPETLRVLRDLEQPVHILGFYTPELADARDNARPLLEEYRRRSDGKVTYEFVDPLSDPVQAERYGINRAGTLVVVVGDSWERVLSAREQDITTAIVRLTVSGQRKVAFLVGHGERDIGEAGDAGYSRLREALEAKGYTVETLSLLAQGEVPEDVNAVVVAGPRQPLSPEEVAALERYVSAGGGLLVMSEPSAVTEIDPADDPLAEYLEETWLIRLRNDVVIDLNSTIQLAAITRRYGDHPITQGLGTLASYFPVARSIEVLPLPEGAFSPSRAALAVTEDLTWGETDLQALLEGRPVDFDPQADLQGPLVLAVAAEDERGSRVVVFGDSDFGANREFVNLANGDLLVNAIDWVARQESLIDLTPKPRITRFVTPPSLEALAVIFVVTVVLIPGGIIGLGVATWLRRRRRG